MTDTDYSVLSQYEFEAALLHIVKAHDVEEVKISRAFLDAGCDPLWPRFERAAVNQYEEGQAVISRYAIWANTVRDNILEGMASLDKGDTSQAHAQLTRAVNSLSAFSELQSLLGTEKASARKL